jgi:hypothetical protein
MFLKMDNQINFSALFWTFLMVTEWFKSFSCDFSTWRKKINFNSNSNSQEIFFPKNHSVDIIVLALHSSEKLFDRELARDP